MIYSSSELSVVILEASFLYLLSHHRLPNLRLLVMLILHTIHYHTPVNLLNSNEYLVALAPS